VLSSNRNGVTLRLHAGSGASESELVRLLREALASLAASGRGLKP
jgi:ParB family chromosome partitioning protein